MRAEVASSRMSTMIQFEICLETHSIIRTKYVTKASRRRFCQEARQSGSTFTTDHNVTVTCTTKRRFWLVIGTCSNVNDTCLEPSIYLIPFVSNNRKVTNMFADRLPKHVSSFLYCITESEDRLQFAASRLKIWSGTYLQMKWLRQKMKFRVRGQEETMK